MATQYLFTTITSGATQYGQAMSAFIGMLTGAGWVVRGSGDGAGGTFSTSTSVFTGTGSGAGGWSNANAWIRIQDPSASREFLIQHDNGGGAKIRYSPFSLFTNTANGAVSATVPPTAQDEKYLRGSAATFGAAWFAVAATVTYYGAAFDTSPYGFWFAGSTGSATKTGLTFDPVTSQSGDPDPYVIQVGSTNSYAVNTSNLGRDGNSSTTWSVTSTTFGGTTEGCFSVMGPERSFYYVQPAGYACGTGAVTANYIINGSGLAANPFNTKSDPFPVLYVRMQQGNATVSPGIKGWSTLARWTTTTKTSAVDTLNSQNFMCVGALWLPWNATAGTPTG